MTVNKYAVEAISRNYETNTRIRNDKKTDTGVKNKFTTPVKQYACSITSKHVLQWLSTLGGSVQGFTLKELNVLASKLGYTFSLHGVTLSVPEVGDGYQYTKYILSNAGANTMRGIAAYEGISFNDMLPDEILELVSLCMTLMEIPYSKNKKSQWYALSVEIDRADEIVAINSRTYVPEEKPEEVVESVKAEHHGSKLWHFIEQWKKNKDHV